MVRKCLAICVFLVAAVTTAHGQTRSKQVKQPREVVEAFRVCTEFRSLVAEKLEFDRAFEATYVKDPARRRAIAATDSDLASGDLSQVDTDTVVEIYKYRVQLFILMLPLMFAGTVDTESELLPPRIAAILQRKPPKDSQQIKAYVAQLKRDVTDFRAHVENLASKHPDVGKNIRSVRDSLLTPLQLPKNTVKPLTADSKRRVLPAAAKYYQIDDCAVVREGGQMRLVEYTFITFRN